MVLKKMVNTFNAKNEESNLFSLIAGFVLMFIYGMLLLMIGYTNNSLQSITGLSGGQSIILAIPQSVGLVVCTIILKSLLSRYNIRTLLVTGYIFALFSLIVIATLDKIANSSANPTTTALVVFIICGFILGVSIGLTSPVISTYFGSVFTGKKRATMLSVVNGVYGIGAGIIPLAASKLIYGAGGAATKSHFDNVRVFYEIAIGFACVGILASLFLNYRHTLQNISMKKVATPNEKNERFSKQQSVFMTAVVLIVLAIFFYMIAETISNYAIVKFFQRDSSLSSGDPVIVTSFQAFGLFIMVQGLWRCASGLWVVKRVRLVSFTICSALLIILAYALILGDVLSNTNLAYLIAIIMAFGLGNCWSTLFSYGSGIDNKRAGFTGIAINITAMSTILGIQLVSAFSIPSKYTDLAKTHGGIAIASLGLVTAFLIIVTLLILSKYLKFKNQTHPDDVKQVAITTVTNGSVIKKSIISKNNTEDDVVVPKKGENKSLKKTIQRDDIKLSQSTNVKSTEKIKLKQ